MAKGTVRAKKTLLTEQPRLLNYVPKDTQKAIALNVGNTETQRDIILKHIEARHPGLASIFNDNYYSEVDEFIQFVEDKNPEQTTEGLSRKLGIKKLRGQEVPKIKKPRITKKITVRRGSKTYKKTKPKRFENKKFVVAFIKKQSQEKLTMKEITERFNKIARERGWQERTVSSLRNIKQRNIKKQ